MARPDTPLPPPPPAAPPHPLVVRNLSAFYGSRQVLKGVNLTVKQGEVRVILGGSGGGKTTLLKHLIGLLQPTIGDVQLLGCKLSQADEPQREAVLRQIGMLFQSGALLNSLTLVQNIALPLRECTDLPEAVILDICHMKLAMVSLGHAAHLYPPELSGGMKKRAALARAMALDPAILFCDEPSAGLDPVTAADLDALILSLRDQFGTTVVVVTHELSSIEAIADQVVMLAGGEVIADGPLSEVKRSTTPTVRSFFGRVANRAADTQTHSLFDRLTL
jgi:phospholipid/cholesterol/gamma-HCH transport system ATP-binding protein